MKRGVVCITSGRVDEYNGYKKLQLSKWSKISPYDGGMGELSPEQPKQATGQSRAVPAPSAVAAPVNNPQMVGMCVKAAVDVQLNLMADPAYPDSHWSVPEVKERATELIKLCLELQSMEVKS